MTFASVVLLSTVLAGCTSNSGNNGSGGSSNGTSSPSNRADEEKAPDRYDPPIELTTVTFDYGTDKFGEGDDLNNNAWTREIMDRYGIAINTLWSVPGAQYEQKSNLMIASNDLPDFFAVKPLQFAQLAKAGLIEDMTDAYSKHASEGIKKVMTESGEEPLQSATIDGRLMAIPWTGTVRESVPVLWIREDWLNKLGLQKPKTMDDLLAISKAFTEEDPDGNGEDDTFGLAVAKDLASLIGFFNGHHVYRGIWLKQEDGTLAYSSIQPEMKAPLQKLQDMYKEKQLDREFGVKDLGKAFEMVGEGKIGMLYGSMGYSTFPLVNLTPDQEWTPVAAPSVDDKPTKFQHGLNIANYYWVVKKGTKHPEAIFKLIELWLEKFYYSTVDEDYNQFVVDQDGATIWNNAPVKVYLSYNNVNLHRHLLPLLKKDGEATEQELAQLTPTERVWYRSMIDYKNGDMKQWGRDRKAGINSSSAIVDEYIDNNQFMPDQFISTPTPAMAKKWANLLKMEDEMITNIILGEPISQFDRFVSDWKKLGGDEITKEVNEWHDNQ